MSQSERWSGHGMADQSTFLLIPTATIFSSPVRTSPLRANCIKGLKIMHQRVTLAFSHSNLENQSEMRMCLEKRNC